jgi:thiosulfate dehydrogenase
MKRFSIGLITGICIPLLAVYCFFVFGGMPVATEGPPLPLERFFVGKALHAAIHPDSDKRSPFPMDENGLISGAKNYANQCAGCHGLPDSQAPRFAATMFPKAPQLFSEKENVNDDPEGVTYWKVKNGIRLTGMPAFKTILSETELWQLSLLLTHSDQLPPNVLKELSGK